jgi:hypothetical protein
MTTKKKTTKAKAKEEVSIEEAEGKTGVKETVVNEDAVALAEESDEEVAMPSFFIEDNDEIVIEVDILFDKRTGRLTSVSRSGIVNKDDFQTMGHSVESFTFRPVNYDEITKYRQKCSTYRMDAGRSLVDPIHLRNFLIVWHLKDWTIKNGKGKKVELKFSDEGALDAESIEKVYSINPTLLDVVLTLFEKDMMM